jgi:hypothetical protein
MPRRKDPRIPDAVLDQLLAGADPKTVFDPNGLLDRRGLRPQFQRKKPRGKKMPVHIARGNATRARVVSLIEHVFAAQKCRLGLVVRTVGIVRARIKIGLANLAYNFTRLAWLNGRAIPA